MESELDEKIKKKNAGLRAKTYSYLADDDSGDKNQKTKICVNKRKLEFYDYEIYLEATQL